ncbi:MAG: hypothetical protein L3K04_01180 [Thermoplasmata archaeon]|nr:hypothetical protein [Thermoplasmata archaeon]MCI4338154.1 hypothetical protein [Thermoplasmata archaeon]MCI4340773.1 hypothetical protein [Thermoplasmata archaeon]
MSSETAEQAELRRHVSELRHAARAIGHDFTLKYDDMEAKIARLPTTTRKEAKYLLWALEDDFTNAQRTIDTELRKLPGAVKGGLVTAADAVVTGTTRAINATHDAFVDAGHAAKEGGKNTFARMAGVKRKPMTEWKKP